MGVAQEVAAFDQHVGGEQQFFAGTWPEDGAIVADAEGQPTGAATWGHGGQAGDVVDGRLFVDRAFVLDHTKGRSRIPIAIVKLDAARFGARAAERGRSLFEEKVSEGKRHSEVV